MINNNHYLERIAEYVYDEKLLVTFRYLSLSLGIHVNLSKKLLQEFLDSEEKKGKSINSLYYLSGKVRCDDGDCDSPSNPFDCEKISVLVCRGDEVSQFEKKLTEVISKHVYAVSIPPISFDNLAQGIRSCEKVTEERGIWSTDYGPLKCKGGVQQINADLEIQSQNNLINQNTEKPSSFFVSSAKEDKKESPQVKKSPKKPTKRSPTQENRLKTLFASAASKSTEVKKADAQQDSKEDGKEAYKVLQKSKTKNSLKEPTEKGKKSRTNNSKTVGDISVKRKRLRDILSSSEDESDNISSNADMDVLPESPIPQRMVIDSDSEDETKSVHDKKDEQDHAVEVKDHDRLESERKPKRRRVMKTQSKTFMDADGYLVTKKEQIVVSESDDSDREEDKRKKQKNSRPSSVEASSDNKGGKLQNKRKQASLMSFFNKK